LERPLKAPEKIAKTARFYCKTRKVIAIVQISKQERYILSS
jgi:hypothetical protein